MQELLQELGDAEKDESVKIIVLTGAGEKAFCAGLDLKAIKDITPLKMWELLRLLHKVTLAIEENEKPVIAARAQQFLLSSLFIMSALISSSSSSTLIKFTFNTFEKKHINTFSQDILVNIRQSKR